MSQYMKHTAQYLYYLMPVICFWEIADSNEIDHVFAIEIVLMYPLFEFYFGDL